MNEAVSTLYVMKRNGDVTYFNKDKIYNAIRGAFDDAYSAVETVSELYLNQIWDWVNSVVTEIEEYYSEWNDELQGYIITVEEIQDIVEKVLMVEDPDAAKAYIIYRYQHALERENKLDGAILDIVNYQNEEVKQENANKNPEIIPTQRDYIAGELSKKITYEKLLPKDISNAHQNGEIHFHDADYFIQHSHNCDLVNLRDMLQNGTVISGVKIDKPHKFSTACNIATQIIAQVASCQYGGQSISLYHLSEFVEESRRYFGRKYNYLYYQGFLNIDDYEELIEKMVKNDVKAGIQIIQYQIITLMTTNGQAPFITVFMDLTEAKTAKERKDLAMCIEEMLRQRIKGVKNEAEQWVTTAFPKLIYALDDCNMGIDAEYYWLTRLAAECTAKRMVPDYISNKVMRKLKGDTYTCMGCRSFLTPDRFTDVGIGNIANAKNYVEGEHRYYGRFNQGVCTLNLPYYAAMAKYNQDKGQYDEAKASEFFWEYLDYYANMCHRALKLRHKRLLGTVSDVAPILWQHGALARLKSGEKIDPLLFNGYSTISLGYAGLWEAVKIITGHDMTDDYGRSFGLKVMKKLNEYTAAWKAEENIDYSLYGTPIESTTYKFAKAINRDFPGFIDKDYITNSYHVNVTKDIDAFSKLKFEAEFQALSPGGAISYVEVPNMLNNIEAVLSVISCIYDNIMYAELNTKSDYCQSCGYEGEMPIVEDDTGKLIFECPKCGERDRHKLNIARRVCGYISTNEFNQGRTQEIKERVLHL